MILLNSTANLARWIGIFVISLIFAWPDTGVSQTPVASVPAVRLAAARSLVHEAEQEAKTLHTDQERGALRSLARAQAKTGDIKGAQQTLAAVPDLPDTQTTCFVIQEIAVAQAVAGDMPCALGTAAMLPEGPPRDLALNAIVKARTGDVAGAVQTATSITDDHQRSTALTMIAETQADRGDRNGAWTTVGMISDRTMQDLAEVKVALVLARAGDTGRLIAIRRRKSSAYSRVIGLCQSAEDILKNTIDTYGIDNFFPPEVRP